LSNVSGAYFTLIVTVSPTNCAQRVAGRASIDPRGNPNYDHEEGRTEPSTRSTEAPSTFKPRAHHPTSASICREIKGRYMMKARPRVQSRPIQSSSSSLAAVLHSPAATGCHTSSAPENRHPCPMLPSNPILASSSSVRRNTVMFVLKALLAFQLVVFLVTNLRQASDDGSMS
jgi:hypothetical protein